MIQTAIAPSPMDRGGVFLYPMPFRGGIQGNWEVGVGNFRLRTGEGCFACGRNGEVSPPGEVLSSEGKYPKFAGAAAPDPERLPAGLALAAGAG